MEKKSDTGAPAFTVRQLSELFGKSEDTIRRWKNEGIGKGEDNIRLVAVENEDAFGHRTSRHLTFTRSAVRDFVRTNPFLMDDAPLLREFMEQEDTTSRVIALPASLDSSRADDRGEEPEFPRASPLNDPFLRSFFQSMNRDDEEEFAEDEFDTESDGRSDEPFTPPPPRGRRRPPFEEEEDSDKADERQKRYDEATIHYMLRLLRRREADCRREMDSIRRASTIFYRRRDIADALADGGDYISDLVQQREEQLDAELEKIRETTRALEGILW